MIMVNSPKSEYFESGRELIADQTWCVLWECFALCRFFPWRHPLHPLSSIAATRNSIFMSTTFDRLILIPGHCSRTTYRSCETDSGPPLFMLAIMVDLRSRVVLAGIKKDCFFFSCSQVQGWSGFKYVAILGNNLLYLIQEMCSAQSSPIPMYTLYTFRCRKSDLLVVCFIYLE